ncbi:hypothetical protein JMJ77_0010101 [Colletotrichum scovillei]|uniref:Uncharacterized protein n=1 Tax=Colletotrichum scovillei TaxID=1209932 RepID=A0A9P7U907_9PEZI|nr:hypothetical protein JMJ78_0011480 [Colletotrichum scovillei]KAG7041994.1 hypothetical protein JMJ77_0010101 [Colletotrichum scovillei]KAG7062025.1 hypothetical protein JMJ76_0006308 [Colletotrichum scovillei]
MIKYSAVFKIRVNISPGEILKSLPIRGLLLSATAALRRGCSKAEKGDQGDRGNRGQLHDSSS